MIVAIDNAGTVELAVINLAGGANLDETGLISTTAISGAATSASVFYSTTARTSVPYRVVGCVDSTQATAGTWATTPSLVQGMGGNALDSMQSIGYGQTPQTVTRNTGTTYYNTTGKPIFLTTVGSGASASCNFTISINGGTGVIYAATAAGTGGTSCCGSYIIPPSASYVITEFQINSRTHSELR
jgi:hypothetical protein